MSETALKLEHVSKVYKLSGKKKKSAPFHQTAVRLNAVDDVSLQVVQGEIFGLLGPNGAGKSTILKMICGLISPSAGTIDIGGERVEADNAKAREQLGALIEMPSFFKHKSALDNLKFLGALQGNVSDERILDILKLLQLDGRMNDKISTYSLGMLQKVGIAQAIIHQPKLLILDEPTNGLDPQWIINIRELLKRLSREYGMTILISSHILSEMQALCDRVAILDKGKVAAVKDIADFDRTEDGKVTVCLKVSDLGRAVEIAEKLGYTASITDGALEVAMQESEISVLTKELVLGDVCLNGMNVKRKTLEDVFKEATNGGHSADAESVFGAFGTKGGERHE